MLVKRNVKRVYEAQFWPSEIRSAGGHCVEGVAGGKRGCSSEFLVRPATHLSVVLDVVSERDEARLELLWVESSRARLVEVQERASELLQLLVADALRVARQDLHHSTPHIVQCASSPNFHRFTNLHFTVDFLLTSFPMDFDCFVGGIGFLESSFNFAFLVD